MASIFTRYLSNFGEGLLSGLTNPKGVMGDWRHASRLYLDNVYRLAPKTKFLYYVRFEIDKTVLTSTTFTNRHADEVGFLIKTTDFPKYKFDTVTKNQYNKKKIIYKNFNYDSLSMTFHDDSGGVINALWALYMGSYVQDRFNPDAAYSRDADSFRAEGTNFDAFRYGLDKPNRTVDFLKSVTIYSMSRRRFSGWTLINPKITSWAHGSGDYAASEFNENNLSLEYESVVYTSGEVAQDSPKGFATLYYDSTPSPLTVAGGGVATLTGQGGVLDGLESVFGNVASGSAFGSVGGFIGTAVQAINTVRNASQLTGAGLAQEAINIISNPTTIRGVVNTVGGIVGAAFPRNNVTGNETVATPVNLTGGN